MKNSDFPKKNSDFLWKKIGKKIRKKSENIFATFLLFFYFT